MRFTIFNSLIAVGIITLSTSSYAQLDCKAYAHSKPAFDACQSLNRTTEKAKKDDLSRFNQLQSSKEAMSRSVTQPPATRTPQQRATPQVQTQTLQPKKQEEETQPVTPTREFTAPERTVPQLYNPPSNQQQQGRIKYY